MTAQDNNKDYKNTICLPETDFAMRGDLPKREPAMLAQWQQQDLYGAIRAGNAEKPKFILHDGPPYANGNIHIGHAVNKVLKDIVVKSKLLAGFDAGFYPDHRACHIHFTGRVIHERFVDLLDSGSARGTQPLFCVSERRREIPGPENTEPDFRDHQGPCPD